MIVEAMVEDEAVAVEAGVATVDMAGAVVVIVDITMTATTTTRIITQIMMAGPIPIVAATATSMKPIRAGERGNLINPSSLQAEAAQARLLNPRQVAMGIVVDRM